MTKISHLATDKSDKVAQIHQSLVSIQGKSFLMTRHHPIGLPGINKQILNKWIQILQPMKEYCQKIICFFLNWCPLVLLRVYNPIICKVVISTQLGDTKLAKIGVFPKSLYGKFMALKCTTIWRNLLYVPDIKRITIKQEVRNILKSNFIPWRYNFSYRDTAHSFVNSIKSKLYFILYSWMCMWLERARILFLMLAIILHSPDWCIFISINYADIV